MSKSSKIFCLFIFFAFALYSPIILKDKLVDIDYQIVIDPLKNIHSFDSYQIALKQNKILDLQYVRDLSLLLDIKLEKLFGHQVHGLFNVLIWVLTAFLLLLLLGELRVTPITIYVTTLLFISHPLASWVLAWPSARKHLLSLLFIVIASYYAVLLKKQKVKWQIPILIFYLLSVFSQPISALWVFCFCIYFFDEIKSHKVLALFYSLIFCMGLTLMANYAYYSYVYPFVTGLPKLSNNSGLDFVTSVAAVSRSLTQIILPLDFAFDYKKNSIFTLIGLPFFTSLFLVCVSKLNKRTTFLLLSLIFSPLLIVYYRPTNIFVSDTYLVIPLLFTIVCLAFGFKKFKWGKLSVTFAILVVSVLTLKNIREQLFSTDSYEYYRQAYEREPTCRNAIPYAGIELYRNRENFINAASFALANRCLFQGERGTAENIRLYFYLLLFDKKTTLKSKYESLKSINVKRADLYLMETAFEQYLLGHKKAANPSPIHFVSKEDRQLVLDSLVYACSLDEKECDKTRLIKLLKNEFGF